MSARALLASTLALPLAACMTDFTTAPPDPADRIDHFPKSALAEACEEWDEWDKPAPPARIHGGTYYVGTCGIAAILITTAEGHILIDSGTEAGADHIAANIEKLGFSLRHVTTLTHSHEHHDHVGGMARMKERTGAKLVASEAAAPVFATGTLAADDPQAGMHDPFPIATVEETIADLQTLELGGLVLYALATPGHSPGAMSWTWTECQDDDCLAIVYADSLSPVSRDDYRFSDHPDTVAAFRRSLDTIAALECDVLLTPHPSASDMLDRFAGETPLIDRSACTAYADKMRARLDERLAKEAQ
ncbi:subclass B3 metallo-beta-lactamase [Sphingomicrobium clamense]|uniref:subclass B3 metallo-beta-lactamase n=1 Tax=Sphingomicrobium clamense TaxID=2851013 RepID=UPI0021028239|nr:subclass B3 metallo-beta-lactamase [Sphingomicrobium sp. B8]